MGSPAGETGAAGVGATAVPWWACSPGRDTPPAWCAVGVPGGCRPEAFQLIAALAVWALVLTIVSGAAVRLTGSGLGCPDWPNCTRSDVVAPLQFHAWVEFGNRLINAAVTIAAIGA